MYDVTLYIYALVSRRSCFVSFRKKEMSSVTNVKRVGVVVLHPRRKIKNNIRKYVQGHTYIYSSFDDDYMRYE
jgi:hypothetical protein